MYSLLLFAYLTTWAQQNTDEQNEHLADILPDWKGAGWKIPFPELKKNLRPGIGAPSSCLNCHFQNKTSYWLIVTIMTVANISLNRKIKEVIILFYYVDIISSLII